MPSPGRRSQVVRQRSAKPPSSVQLRSPPPTSLLQMGTFLLRFEAHHFPVADTLPTRRDVMAQHAVPQQTTGPTAARRLACALAISRASRKPPPRRTCLLYTSPSPRDGLLSRM